MKIDKTMNKNIDKGILIEMFNNMNLTKPEMEVLKGGATGLADIGDTAARKCIILCKTGCTSGLCVTKGTVKGIWED